MNNVLTILDHEENFIFSTELIPYFLNPFESDLLLGFPILRLKDVAFMRTNIPKQPEPMIRLIL